MKIAFFCEDVSIPKFLRNRFKFVVKKFAEERGYEVGEINYIFCSDQFLLKLNVEFLSHDYFTDIITFDYCKDNFVSGDVYISIDRVLENSIDFGISFENELIRVMSHGFLHLLKYGDKENSEKIIMRKMEDMLVIHYFESSTLLSK